LQILIAHSNENFAYQLKQSLLSISFNSINSTHNGFDALNLIIRSYTKILLIEDTLPGLNANDIIRTLKFKGIKSKIIILGTKQNPLFPKSLNQTIHYINLNQGDPLKKIQSLINILLQSQKPVN